MPAILLCSGLFLFTLMPYLCLEKNLQLSCTVLAIVETVAFFYSKTSPIFVSNKTRHASGSHAHPAGLVLKKGTVFIWFFGVYNTRSAQAGRVFCFFFKINFQMRNIIQTFAT